LRWLIDRHTAGRWLDVVVRVLPITWNELGRDLTRAIEFDQSDMFRKIYEEEFGRAGGTPYGLMVVDHEVSHGMSPDSTVDDVTVLEALRGIGAASFCPMILAASPKLLGLSSFDELQRLPDLDATFRGREYARWNTLLGRRDTEFLAVTLPRVLARVPWRDDGTRPRPFRYDESVPTSVERCWASAGYAFAAVAGRAFTEYGWPADVRGADVDREGGGIVTDLPIEWFATDPVGVWPRLPLETILGDKQERELVELGVMPVNALPFGTELLFGVVRSLRRPEKHIGARAEVADANARLSSQINSVLCASRFAHCLKIMARDMIGSMTTPDEIERRLQKWLYEYVNGGESDEPGLRSRYPLVGGRVEVREIPGSPGSYNCNMHLQPHFQLDDVGASFSLVTEIAPGAR
jgi:type VI secretion system protein ImpD/type VI secretion system protein ImpC